MKAEIFTLCEDASVTNGRLNVQNAFDCFVVERVPHTEERFCLAVRLRFEGSECDRQHEMAIRICGEDGKLLAAPLSTGFHPLLPEQCRTATISFALVYQSVQFQEFGEYMADIAIDGIQIVSIPLFVHQS